jgi:hypothetical protein
MASSPTKPAAPQPSPGTERLQHALHDAQVAMPEAVQKDPQFAKAMQRAGEFYEKFKNDPKAKNFPNADVYVATQLSLVTDGPVRAWLRDDAAGIIGNQSAKSQEARAQNQQSYQAWAKQNTGWRGYVKDQLSINMAGLEGAKGGGSIVANTLSHGLSDKVHLTNSEQYQGADYTASRVLAVAGRELLETAATLGIGAAAKGACRRRGSSTRA